MTPKAAVFPYARIYRSLRYYPEVLIETDTGNIQYPDFELNFIQYVRHFQAVDFSEDAGAQ